MHSSAFMGLLLLYTMVHALKFTGYGGDITAVDPY